MSTRWMCEVCGYEHEGEAPPGVCPVCGEGPEAFSKLEVKPKEDVPQGAATWVCGLCGYEQVGTAPPNECPTCGVEAEEFARKGDAPVAAEALPVAPAAGGLRVVVVGGGVAGFSAAEAARQADAGAQITVFAEEGVLPYHRVALTRLLAGEVERPALALKDEKWYAENRIQVLFSTVERVDYAAHQVFTGGVPLPYDRLILATGATSFMPPLPGTSGGGVFTLRTLQDTERIAEVAERGARCVVIGGGLLGLETAGGLAARGVAVTVLEAAPSLLPRQLTRPAALRLQKHVESLGIAVVVGAQIAEIEQPDLAVRLDLGARFEADFVVVSAGVRPELSLAQGLASARGLLVDDRMMTSDPAVFAAGDLVEHRGVVTGLWSVAAAQGAAAGRFAVSAEAPPYSPPPVATKLKVLNFPLFSGGDFGAEADAAQAYNGGKGSLWVRAVVEGGLLTGAIILGDEALGTLAWRGLGKPLAQQPELLAAVPGLGEWLSSL